ncbi:MAG TPA: hypothetical protein VGH28_05140 [Polyangiaceae bacterium]
MRRAPLVLFAIATLTPAVVLAQSAQDKADAEVLFNAGKAALAAGNLTDACQKLAASQSKDPAIGTALYLAECYERSGKIASAWAQFHQAEDMANQRHDNRGALAKARADRLTPSRITIVLGPGAKDVTGLEVKRDGEVVGAALLGLATPIDGGSHAIVATAPGRRSFEWHGDVPEQRGTITVTIPKLEVEGAPVASATTPPPVMTVVPATTAPPVATIAPPPQHEGGGMSGVKIGGIVVAGVGLASIGVSSILGVVAHDQYQSVLSKNGSGTCIEIAGIVNAQCGTPQDKSTADSAKTMADIGTGVFIGGCVLAVAGIVLFFVAPKAKHDAALTFAPMVGAEGGGASLSGRF